MTTARLRAVLTLFLPAMALGLAAGLAYALRVVGARTTGTFTHGAPHLLLLSPAINVLLLAGATVPLALGAWLLRRQPMRLVIAVTGAIAVFATMLIFRTIHQYASLLLAIGIAFRIDEAYARHPERTTRALRGMVIALTPVWLVLGVGELGAARWRARQGEMLPPSGAPNVLLLILDTVRAKNLSLYRYDRPTTPALERWAKDGVVFDNAIATSSWTLPSHASMFTGEPPEQLSADWRRAFDARYATLAETLHGAGYATGGFVANAWYAGSESGLARGFMRYEDYRLSLRQLFWSSTLTQAPITKDLLWTPGLGGRLAALRRFDWRNPPTPFFDRKTAAQVQAEFLDWQASLGRRPFFAFLNYYDAHLPYRPSPVYRARFHGSDSSIDAYDAAIATIDERIDALLQTLRRRGVLDKTLVIVTSDHGELFGEHGLRAHGNGVYRPLVHVPLLLRLPELIPAGTRVAAPTSLDELRGIILALAGVGHFATHATLPDGRSVFPWRRDQRGATQILVRSYFEGDPEWTKDSTGRGPDLSLMSGRLQYIRNWKGREELYDYLADTAEAQNLIGTALGEELAAPFRAAANADR